MAHVAPGVGAGCAPVAPVAPFWTSTGVILVLFILLAIIARMFVV